VIYRRLIVLLHVGEGTNNPLGAVATEQGFFIDGLLRWVPRFVQSPEDFLSAISSRIIGRCEVAYFIDVTYEVIVFYFQPKVRVFYSIFEDPSKSTKKYERKLVCGFHASLDKYACIRLLDAFSIVNV
jgi:hypothetical protein